MRRDKRKRARRKAAPAKWLWEFSKRVVRVTALLYFAVCIFVVITSFIWVDTTTLATLVSEVNETFRVVVGGYMIKAGVENAVKIAKNRKKSKDDQSAEPDIEFIDLDEDDGALG